MWIALLQRHKTHPFHIPLKQMIQSQDNLLFSMCSRNGLSLLRTQSPIQVIPKALGEPQTTKPETETEIRKTECLQSTSNTFWTWLWSLDAAIMLCLLLFVSGFLAGNAIYGAEVTKELSPLWIAGPLIMAIYIKIFWPFRTICPLRLLLQPDDQSDGEPSILLNYSIPLHFPWQAQRPYESSSDSTEGGHQEH